jgi:hypothetical protein
VKAPFIRGFHKQNWAAWDDKQANGPDAGWNCAMRTKLSKAGSRQLGSARRSRPFEVSNKRFTGDAKNVLLHQLYMLAFGHIEQEMLMNFRLIGAAALSLVLATPAMAMHHRHHHDYSQATYGKSSVQSAYGAYNFVPRDDVEGRSDFPAYDPVPPSANGG